MKAQTGPVDKTGVAHAEYGAGRRKRVRNTPAGCVDLRVGACPAELHRQVRIRAALDGVGIGDVVIAACKAYVEAGR